MKQNANFQWSEEDLEWVWEMATTRGMDWLRDEADRRSAAESDPKG